MKAMVAIKYWFSSTLEERKVLVPEIKYSEVLIKVWAVGVNTDDMVDVTTGVNYFCPGLECSGIIEALDLGFTPMAGSRKAQMHMLCDKVQMASVPRCAGFLTRFDVPKTERAWDLAKLALDYYNQRKDGDTISGDGDYLAAAIASQSKDAHTRNRARRGRI